MLPETVRVGAMFEVPALYWQLDEILARVDFLSVGSNDLAQFVYAADRGNAQLQGRYDNLAPPFQRIIGGIDTEIRRFIAAHVAEEVDSPASQQAKVIDVAEAVSSAWD